MAVISNREELEEWLRDRNHFDSTAIATRAALRALPMITGTLVSDSNRLSSTVVLPVFRGLSLSWFATSWPNASTEALVTARDTRDAISTAAAYLIGIRADSVLLSVTNATASAIRSVTATDTK